MSAVEDQALKEQPPPQESGRQFMSLPPEVRRYIYAEALPPRDYYIHSTEWMECNNDYVPSAILALNRRIFDEALYVLYEHDCAILTVTTSGYHFFDDWIFYAPVACHLLLPDVSFLISNWQISIDSFIHIEHEDLDALNNSTDPKDERDALRWRNLAKHVMEIVQILSLNSDIRTLTIKFPCVCTMHGCEGLSAVRRRFMFLSSVLHSLKQLRVNVRCTFLATGDKNVQCPESRCISLAKAFKGFKDIIESRAIAP